jgi:hypothetical protein
MANPKMYEQLTPVPSDVASLARAMRRCREAERRKAEWTIGYKAGANITRTDNVYGSAVSDGTLPFTVLKVSVRNQTLRERQLDAKRPLRCHWFSHHDCDKGPKGVRPRDWIDQTRRLARIQQTEPILPTFGFRKVDVKRSCADFPR